MYMPNGEFAIHSKNCMFTDTPRSRRRNIRKGFKIDSVEQNIHLDSFTHSASCANMTFYIVLFYH